MARLVSLERLRGRADRISEKLCDHIEGTLPAHEAEPFARIADGAAQAHGAAGLFDDFGLGFAFARMQMLRMGDGPDEVHNRTIARFELDKYRDARGANS